MYIFKCLTVWNSHILLISKRLCLQVYLALSAVMPLVIENCKAHITAALDGPFGLNAT